MGLPFGKDSFAQFRFTSKVPYYYIGFIMMVGVYLIMKKIGRSKLGFALRTIREDEDAADVYKRQASWRVSAAGVPAAWQG